MIFDYFCLKSHFYTFFFSSSLNKIVISQRFRYFLISCVVSVLLQGLVCRRLVSMWCFLSLVAKLYLHEDDLDRQNEFDQSNI